METKVTAKPFDESKYTWYKATKEMTFRTKKDHREVVKKGDKVGVRKATSKKGTYRFILKKTGTGVVFTANEQQHDNIMKNLESASGEPAGENLDIKSLAKEAKATAEKIFKGYKVSVSDINDETNSGYVEMVLKKNSIELCFPIYLFLENGKLRCQVEDAVIAEDSSKIPDWMNLDELYSDYTERNTVTYDSVAKMLSDFSKIHDRAIKDIYKEIGEVQSLIKSLL